jgi:glyoxylase-like metal-dependent hydrolase (beta-lactamase superfamily II)
MPEASPKVTGLFDPETSTITYVVREPAGPACAVIDPVLDYDPKAARIRTRSMDALLAHLRDEGLELRWILETHVHADHLSSAARLREATGARVGIGARVTHTQRHFAPLFDLGDDFPVDGSQFDRLFTDGERFAVGALEFEVLDTPGHTPACVSYRCGDCVFVGDTVFMPDYGTARADFPGGDARTLHRSIRRLLAPRSVAIVGASSDLSKINGRPLKHLLDKRYGGRIYPVNPKYPRIAGVICYPEVAALPETPDLAVIVLPAREVPACIEALGARGVPAAVIFSSGFGEMGEAGRAAELRTNVLLGASGALAFGALAMGVFFTDWGAAKPRAGALFVAPSIDTKCC